VTLKRQLLLVSLLALILPWAGCEFIRETESALRIGQQQMLAGTARALANSMAQYVEEYPEPIREGQPDEQLFLRSLSAAPQIDGYIDDWMIEPASLRSIRGTDGPIRMALASRDNMAYLYVDVSDKAVVYAATGTMMLDDEPLFADRVMLVSSSPPYRQQRFLFAAEAPGPIVSFRQDGSAIAPEPAISAYWQDVPGGYRLEAEIPTDLLGTHLGIVVNNTASSAARPTRSSSFSSQAPLPVAMPSAEIRNLAEGLVQPGMRILITDTAGWRLAVAGELSPSASIGSSDSRWSTRIYDWLVEEGETTLSAEPSSAGREQQPYVSSALDGREMASWFRGEENGRAIVAVAAPIKNNEELLGALILQHGTDAILSSTNDGLVRLINLTLIATFVVAAVLIGYASWLSRRIRHLSIAAVDALENETLHSALPSSLAEDEIGDLSRSFSSVLRQLGDYNAYLRTLAAKLSHELRTPLAIVSSSLENLEHESLSKSSAAYAARARGGADRLRRILSAMSEAKRVEELMEHGDPESFDLSSVLKSTVDAYRDVYLQRNFDFECSVESAPTSGSPELLIQMLDKLVDNAVDFSDIDDTVTIGLASDAEQFRITVTNPGPPLPSRMRTQLFDSMVSMRDTDDSRHLGLGLFVAKLIAEGHGGSILADNIQGGVMFEVRVPRQDSR